jgi:acyl-CoA synthetase (AMP-forming)/AMP-acid ligase II
VSSGIDYAAAHFADDVCVQDETGALTYSQVRGLARALGARLSGAGAVPGDHAAILSLNHRNVLVAQLGCEQAGVIPLGINVLAGAGEIAAMLQAADIKWLFFHSVFAPLVAQLRALAPGLRGLYCIDATHPEAGSLMELPGDAAGPLPVFESAPERITAMFASGGTTGVPKGVLTTERGMATMCASFLACMPHSGRPVHLAVAPISHGAGALVRAYLFQGVRNVLLARPDPDAILQAIQRERVTLLFLPPTLIYKLLSHPKVRDYDYSSLQYLLYSAAPMSPDRLREAISVFGPVLCQTYGQAEAPIICTYFSPQAHVRAAEAGVNERRLQSCGVATPFTRVAVMDEAGMLLPDEEIGEIVVRGDVVMAGYYRNPQATQEASAHGWHHTGDLGYRDTEGYFYLVDRKKDMIISGGFNIYPSEIEKALLSHPDVQDCAVVGAPDEYWGEAVKAVVEPKAGRAPREEDLIAHVKGLLGGMKAPKTVDLCETLPRSPVGKVLRREVRARYWANQSRKI